MKKLLITLITLVAMGCAFEPAAVSTAASDPQDAEHTDIETIDGASFRDGVESPFVLVDLRRDDLAVGVDRTTAELSRIVLICPNNASMSWEEWAQQDAEIAERLSESEGWVGVGATERLARLALAEDAIEGDECSESCNLCPDGAWVCTSNCPAEADERTTRTRSGAPQAPPRRTPSDPGEPSEPSSGSSGSGSGGSSGGSPGSYGASPGAHPGAI